MTQERIPLGAYAVPRDGGDDDRDDIDYTVDSPITVTQTGTTEFQLTVNWPDNLENVRVTITLPSSASPGTASITPQQTNQSIDVQSDGAVFTHDEADHGDTISYKLDLTADSSGNYGVTFKFEAEELTGPISRSEGVDFVT